MEKEKEIRIIDMNGKDRVTHQQHIERVPVQENFIIKTISKIDMRFVPYIIGASGIGFFAWGFNKYVHSII